MTEPAGLLDLMPFAKDIGVEVLSADASEVRGRLEWAPGRCTTAGVLHGGALMTLADSTGAICAFLCSVHAGYIVGQNILADGGAYPGTF